MECLCKLRITRNVFLKSFLIGLVPLIILWLFLITNAIEHFMWALPGMTVESANISIFWMLFAMDIAIVTLFLVPALAISCEIYRIKSAEASVPAKTAVVAAAAKPASISAKPKAKAKKKK